MRPELRIDTKGALVTTGRLVESPERKRRVSADPSLALRALKMSNLQTLAFGQSSRALGRDRGGSNG